MPGQGRKHLQLAGIGFADAWLGLEASATCWNWICRCLAGVGSICNLLELDLQMPGQGRKHPQLAGYEFADTYPGVGSICNLLELDLQMPGQGRKHPQLAGYEFADTYPGVGSICNLLELDLQMPITKLILRILQQLRWDCFLCRKKSKMFSWTCGAYCAKI